MVEQLQPDVAGVTAENREIDTPVEFAGSKGQWGTGANVGVPGYFAPWVLTPHSGHTASFAAELAAAGNAALTLVHITTGVEVWGPGGLHVDIEWKDIIVDNAIKGMADLQRQVGNHAGVIIESGNVPKLLNQAAERIKADVLVIGRSPGRHHLGDNGDGYGIIRESRIPVLSV